MSHGDMTFVLWLLFAIAAVLFLAGGGLIWLGHEIWAGVWRLPERMLGGFVALFGIVLLCIGGWGVWGLALKLGIP